MYVVVSSLKTNGKKNARIWKYSTPSLHMLNNFTMTLVFAKLYGELINMSRSGIKRFEELDNLWL